MPVLNKLDARKMIKSIAYIECDGRNDETILGYPLQKREDEKEDDRTFVGKDEQVEWDRKAC